MRTLEPCWESMLSHAHDARGLLLASMCFRLCLSDGSREAAEGFARALQQGPSKGGRAVHGLFRAVQGFLLGGNNTKRLKRQSSIVELKSRRGQAPGVPVAHGAGDFNGKARLSRFVLLTKGPALLSGLGNSSCKSVNGRL